MFFILGLCLFPFAGLPARDIAIDKVDPAISRKATAAIGVGYAESLASLFEFLQLVHITKRPWPFSSWRATRSNRGHSSSTSRPRQRDEACLAPLPAA